MFSYEYFSKFVRVLAWRVPFLRDNVPTKRFDPMIIPPSIMTASRVNVWVLGREGKNVLMLLLLIVEIVLVLS